MRMKLIISLGATVLAAFLVGCAGNQQPADAVATGQPPAEPSATTARANSEPTRAIPEEPTPLPQYRIISVLPKDAIPAIFDPQFLSAEEADSQYDADEMVLGVEINGDVRAYSIPHLSGHEIVNDTVGGVPIAVTW